MKRIVLQINEFDLYQQIFVFDDNDVIIDGFKATMHELPFTVGRFAIEYDINEICLQQSQYAKKIEERIKRTDVEKYISNNLIFKYI